MSIQHAHPKPSSIAGNGLFANQAISSGEAIVILERPLVAVLDYPRLSDTCSHCFTQTYDNDYYQRERIAVSACTGCKAVRYCSKKCQSQSWKRSHKWECKNLREIPNAPNAVRAALQLRTLLEHDSISDDAKRAVKRAAMSDDVFERHLRSDFPPGYYSHVKKESANVEAGTETVEDSLKKIMTNALTLVKSTFDPLGIAFDPLICSANHSCDPNAVITFDGPIVSLRSLRAIAKDEEVLITYIDCTNPYYFRQEELKDRHGFICDCRKCQRKGEDESPLTSVQSIEKSGQTISEEVKNVTNAITNDTDTEQQISSSSLFADLERARSTTDDQTSISACMKIMQQIPSITQQPSAAARDELFARSCSLGNFSTALSHGIRRYFDTDPILYPTPFHPVRVVHSWALVKLLMGMYSSPEDVHTKALVKKNFDFVIPIWKLLKELVMVVDRSHGSESWFAKCVKDLLQEVREGIVAGSPEGLGAVEADPGRYWDAFERLKYDVKV